MTSERAVSPVMGVILLVAVTVVLSATIGVFVLDLADSGTQSADHLSENVQISESGPQEAQLMNMGDETEVSSLQLVVSADGKSATVHPDGTVEGDLDVSVGGAFVTDETWEAGGTTNILIADAYDTDAKVSIVEAEAETVIRTTDIASREVDADATYRSDCLEIKQAGESSGDGVYEIDPDGDGPIEVYCDMTTDGGGWTLVASYVDGSYWYGGMSDSAEDHSDEDALRAGIEWSARQTRYDQYVAADGSGVVGSAADATTTDTRLASYTADMEFEEMMFADEDADFIKYPIAGEAVADWYAGLYTGMNYEENVAECDIMNDYICEEMANDFYEPSGTNIDPEEVNYWDDLTIRFLPEDSDTRVGYQYNHLSFGPTWKRSNNCESCTWDEGGTGWHRKYLGGDEQAQSDRILWYVR